MHLYLVRSSILRNRKSISLLVLWRFDLVNLDTFEFVDNTGAWVVEVNPPLRCNQMCDNVELYIKLKL